MNHLCRAPTRDVPHNPSLERVAVVAIRRPIGHATQNAALSEALLLIIDRPVQVVTIFSQHRRLCRSTTLNTHRTQPD